MLPLSEWQTLFAVQAGAAATFTGLIFVAVSINQAKIISVRGLPFARGGIHPSVPAGVFHFNSGADPAAADSCAGH